MSKALPAPDGRGISPGGYSKAEVLDEAGFDALYRASLVDVHAYALSLLGDRQAAEDVTALAFERLYRARARLDHGRGTPRAWLFAIARNAALDELRRRARQPRFAMDENVGGEDLGQAIERVEQRATLREAISTLPPRDREVVLLKFHGQLSNGELARALGISESNAGTRLHRALSRLRGLCLELDRREVA